MPKKLEILIPHYHEEACEIQPLLDSIQLQQAVDFKDVGVIICHDGVQPDINSDSYVHCEWHPKENESCDLEFYDDAAIGGNYSLFHDYSFEIKQIHQEHKGVSAARNACLDTATADYVMWCDADDMFFNMMGISFIFKEIELGGFNALISVFVEETRDKDGKPFFLNHEKDFTFVHGKVYNRQYLIDNKIRWCESLRIHEDSYFNGIATKMTPDVKYCTHAFYLWKWRDNSVCRHDPKYILKTYNNMLDSNTALINDLLLRGRGADARGYVCSMIYTAYFTMNKKEWMEQDNQEYRNSTERYFKECWLKFRDLYYTATDEQKKKLLVSAKNKSFNEGVMFESITFDDWIRHIEELE